jgi:hypothetical protein
MIQVSDIYQDAKNIIGTCDDATLFRRISEAVEVLANKGDFDPLLGTVDIISDQRTVAMPREVENVMAVNINGRSTIGRDRWFNFHVNGPGDLGRPCQWQWQDGADSPLFRNLVGPSRLAAICTEEEDEESRLRAYGYDVDGKWIRTKEDGVWRDGWLVPVVFGFSIPDEESPLFARITRISRAQTVATVKLFAFEADATEGIAIGQYEFDETNPIYRRIELPRVATTVRVAFRRRVFKVTSQESVIPLHSTAAILEALRAFRAYSNDSIALAQAHEATAARLITEEQTTRTPPTTMPVQISPIGMVVDNWDNMD